MPSLGLFFGAVSPRLARVSIQFHPAHWLILMSSRRQWLLCVAIPRQAGSTKEWLRPICRVSFHAITRVGKEKVKREMRTERVPILCAQARSSSRVIRQSLLLPIGPGTGYAPFRGFIQERSALAKAGKLLGPAHLFFGCRDESKDHIYQAEMTDAVASKTLSSLNVAYSRATSDRKLYVQDKLMSAAKVIYDIMKGKVGGNEGSIYVCGDAKGMARDVHRALHNILHVRRRVRRS